MQSNTSLAKRLHCRRQLNVPSGTLHWKKHQSCIKIDAFFWWPIRESNSGLRLERAPSWPLDQWALFKIHFILYQQGVILSRVWGIYILKIINFNFLCLNKTNKLKNRYLHIINICCNRKYGKKPSCIQTHKLVSKIMIFVKCIKKWLLFLCTLN